MIAKSPSGRSCVDHVRHGWVTTFIQLGWFGGLAVRGVAALLCFDWGTAFDKIDHFAMLALAAAITSTFLMFSGNQNQGVLGVVMWTLFGLVQASAFAGAHEQLVLKMPPPHRIPFAEFSHHWCVSVLDNLGF
ncbi:MAG: hypothetical protein R2832_03985 [Rhodothermales bacterium]